MDCSPPGSSVHGMFQARILECVAISFSRSLDLKLDFFVLPRESVLGECPGVPSLENRGWSQVIIRAQGGWEGREIGLSLPPLGIGGRDKNSICCASLCSVHNGGYFFDILELDCP